MNWLARFFRKRNREAALDSELRFHIDQRTAELVAEGVNAAEAHRRAMVEFGGIESVKEECRETGAMYLLRTVLQDVRYALRQLCRDPGFAVVAVATLALGIGANASVFSVVNAVVLQPLPYSRPHQLVQIIVSKQGGGVNRTGASYPDFLDWRSGNHAFSSVAAYQETFFTLTGHGRPKLMAGTDATPSLFSILGVTPLLGRAFTWQDERPASAPVALISESLWRSRYGASPDLIGETIKLNEKPFTVVGILPSSFRFPFGPKRPEIWLPVTQDPTFGVLATLRAAHYLKVIARLRQGVGVSQAQAQMDTILNRLAADYPKTDAGWTPRIVPLKQQLVGAAAFPLLVLLGAAALVLLIACVNVVGVLLARATSRSQEMCIRAALGASSGRLTRQVLTESLLLSLLSGAFGLLLTLSGLGLLTSLLPKTLPRVHHIQVDAWVLGFTVGASVLVGMVSGLALAFHQSGNNLNEVLREGGRGSIESRRRNRMRSTLMVCEIALTMVILASAGLLVRSLLGLENVRLGFNPRHLVEVTLTLPRKEYRKPEQWAGFFTELLRRVRALPGVSGVGATLMPPLTGVALKMHFVVQGRPAPPRSELPSADYSAISSGYFHALEAPLLDGRSFSAADTATSVPVAIINKTLATDYFPNQSPIGQRIEIIYPGMSAQDREIVGVVGNVRAQGPNRASPPALFTPYTQTPWWTMAILTRTPANPTAFVGAVRSQLEGIDANLALGRVVTMEQNVRQSLARARLYVALLGSFALLTLVLAAVGVYGLISYAVRERTREIGIRMALGASRVDVLQLVLNRGLRMTAIGVIIGLATALAVTRVMASLLYGITPDDPLTFITAAMLLVAVTLAASYVPARRAARVDPNVALRQE
jgi:putative ABC transport system permease protein